MLHVVMLGAGGAILLRAAYRFLQRPSWNFVSWQSKDSPTSFTLGAALCGFGALLTVAAIPIHRHYLWVAFPLTFVWLAWLALHTSGLRWGRAVLAVLCLVQGLIAFAFLDYVHTNQRIICGD